MADNEPRILTVVAGLGPGGTERVAQNFAVGYHRRGLPSAVMTWREGGVRTEELSLRGIPVFVTEPGKSDRKRATSEALEWSPNVVHIHRFGFADPDVAEILQSFKRANNRIKIIETNVFGKPDYSSERDLIDIHLMLSKWAIWKWRKLTRSLRPAPIGVVIPNAIDDSAFYPTPIGESVSFRQQLGVPSDALLFLCIAQPAEWKWPAIVFDAFEAVAHESSDVFFLVAGLSEGARIQIRNKPDHIARRIIELPFIHGDETLRKVYSACDVFLHACDLGESFGMVFLEALLCGMPVISLSRPAKNNSHLEVIGHMKGGMLVNDLQSMIEAMKALTYDSALRCRLAETGREQSLQRYSLNVVVSRLIDISMLALTTKTREELSRTLEADPKWITRVTDAEIDTLMYETMGRVRAIDRIQRYLIHHPSVYRTWRFLKPEVSKR